MARYLITGASGFIGGHVAERLASDGHQLRCLVRETSSVEVLEPLGVELVHGSITDRAAVASAVEDMDVVIHLAGMTSAQRYEQMLQVNRDGSWQVARACAEQAQPPILLLVSSIAAAGPVSNIVLAVGCLAGLKIITLSMDPWAIQEHSLVYPVFLMCQTGLFLNVILAVFNLLPVPPLDGSWILAGVLPSNLAAAMDTIRPYSFILLIALLLSGVFGMILNPILRFVGRLAL